MDFRESQPLIIDDRRSIIVIDDNEGFVPADEDVQAV
jgi:hypothetical protein